MVGSACAATSLTTRIHFDGGCKRGRMSVCVVVLHEGVAVVSAGMIGRGDSFDAEWLALLNAMEVARALPSTRVRLSSDNLSVAEMVSDARAAKAGRSLRYRAAFERAACGFADVRCEWVQRRLNLAGRYLEGGPDEWFLAGLDMLEGIAEYRMEPLPQSVQHHFEHGNAITFPEPTKPIKVKA